MSEQNGQNLEELATQLRKAAKAYYDSDTLLMSDVEYDAGIEQLRIAVAEDDSLAGEFTDLLEQVAAGQSAGGDVEHPTMMGSMTKVPTLDAVVEFVEKVQGPVVVEPKLDGLAVRAVYDAGKLTLVATRGDGHTGEDITDRARKLKIFPSNMNGTALEGESFELRGEVFMQDRDFPTANKVRKSDGATEFVNTRNAAAGILRKGDARYANLLQFAAYGVTGLTGGEYVDQLQRVNDAGVTTSVSLAKAAGFSSTAGNRSWTDFFRRIASPVSRSDGWVSTQSSKDVLERIDTIGKERANLGFPIDGAVVKAVNESDRTRLGEGSRAPRWAVAYKYEAESAETTVVGITTAVGRTGRLAIRIEVTPVFVGGTTISYASGHNVSWMQEKDVRVGDTVTLRRANDVIPYVSEVLLDHRPDDAEKWEPPENDPLGRPWNKDTLLWRSTSPELSVLGTIVYATSRDALDVEGIGTEIATALVDSNLVSNMADLFDLTEKQLAELQLTSGRVVGETVGAKIKAELDQAKKAPWNRVITALGMRATGQTMSRRLAAAFPTLERLRSATVEDLASVEGIATKKAGVIHEGIRTLDDSGVLDRLDAAGVNTGEEPEESGDSPSALDGESVVVTGKVGTLTRTEVQERIESLGGRASSSVSSSTTLLVADPSATSSKVKKAQSLGIRIISPDDFLAL